MAEQTDFTYAQQGDVVLFEDHESSGPMWSQEGDRRVRLAVKFPRSYSKPPLVQLSVSLMDARTDFMIRYKLTAENIEADGFNIVFSTWSDSKFARLGVNWLAIGPTIPDEYWVDF